MPITTYHSSCLSRRTIARDVVELKITKPADFAFRPGQFILFDVPLLSNPADIQTRAFSIASGSDESDLVFVFKLKEEGRASAWVETLQAGDTVSFKGPFGFFTLRDGPENVAMLCTSTGIAPFRSMLLDAEKKKDTRRFDVIFGVRHEDDLFWKEELEKITQRMENVSVHFALSQPGDAWTGHKGRIQTLIPLVLEDLIGRTVYVCGNPDMTSDIKKRCLEEWQIPKERLHVEGYI